MTDDLAELAELAGWRPPSSHQPLRRARPVVGPQGQRYRSASLAAAAEGVSVHTMVSRCRNGYHGWRYADVMGDRG